MSVGFVGNEQVDSLRVADADGMDFDFPFRHEFRYRLRVDPHVRFAVGDEDDVFVTSGAGKAFGREQEPFADVGSRQTGNFLMNGIGRDFGEDCRKGIHVARERAEKKGLPGEYHESEAVSVAFHDEIREHALSRFQTVRTQVFREHRFGNVEDEDYVGTFFGFRGFHIRIPRISQERGKARDDEAA